MGANSGRQTSRNRTAGGEAKPETQAPSSGASASEIRLEDLIADIYDAALEPEGWLHVAARVAERMGAYTAAVSLFDIRSGVCQGLASYRIDPALWKPYEDYYSKIDLWNAALTRLPAEQAYLGQTSVSDEQLLRSEIYNDHYRHAQMFHALGGLPLRENNHAFLFGLQRPRSRTPFSPAEQALFQQLFPHLKRAAQLHLRFQELSERASAGAHVLDQMPMGVILLDASGHVVFANAAAEAAVNENDGLSLVRGQLVAAARAEAVSLRQLIAGAARTGLGDGREAGGALAITRPSLRRSYAVLVSPLPGPRREPLFDFGRRRPVCVVFVSEPDRCPSVPADVVAQAYALSPAEARFATAFLAELSVKQTADRLGITEGSARQYLKRLFLKTDTRSQADLVRLLATGPAVLRRP